MSDFDERTKVDSAQVCMPYWFSAVAHLAVCCRLGGVSRVLRVGGVLQVLENNVCRFTRRRGVDKVTQGANLTKSPQPSSRPSVSQHFYSIPSRPCFPRPMCVTWGARPLLPVPSRGFVHAGRWAESTRRVRDTAISAQVNLIPWVEFLEKLTSGCVFLWARFIVISASDFQSCLMLSL